jgi:serine/threonine protein kinase
MSATQTAVVPAPQPTRVARQLEDADRLCVSALKEVHVGRELGRGSFKVTYQKCSDATCTKVPEVLQVVSAATPEALADVRREALLLDMIAKETKVKGVSPIVVPIIQYYECPKTAKAFIVQPRMEGTMEGLGLKQWNDVAAKLTPAALRAVANTKRRILVFRPDQLLAAFGLANELYRRYGLVHGDLKPDNILVDAEGRFFLGDLGFTGSYRGPFSKIGGPAAGFSRNFGCPGEVPINPQYRSHFNVWQLELLLRADYITLITLPSPLPQIQKMVVFESVEQLGKPKWNIPPDVRVHLDGLCLTLTDKLRVHDDIVSRFVTGTALASGHALLPAMDKAPDNRDNIVKAIFLVRSRPDFVNLPDWLKYLVQQGLVHITSQDSSTVYLPESYVPIPPIHIPIQTPASPPNLSSNLDKPIALPSPGMDALTQGMAEQKIGTPLPAQSLFAPMQGSPMQISPNLPQIYSPSSGTLLARDPIFSPASTQASPIVPPISSSFARDYGTWLADQPIVAPASTQIALTRHDISMARQFGALPPSLRPGVFIQQPDNKTPQFYGAQPSQQNPLPLKQLSIPATPAQIPSLGSLPSFGPRSGGALQHRFNVRLLKRSRNLY